MKSRGGGERRRGYDNKVKVRRGGNKGKEGGGVHNSVSVMTQFLLFQTRRGSDSCWRRERFK